MSLASFLPKPQHSNSKTTQIKSFTPQLSQNAISKTGPPPYRHRKGWIPKTLIDFGDGGAFPEIHVAQFPHELGRKRSDTKTNTIALTVDESGEIKYDAIAKYGHSNDRIIHKSLNDMIPLDRTMADEFARPSELEVQSVKEKTQAALEKILDRKIKAKDPKNIHMHSQTPSYIKYTPQRSDAKLETRIIRMVEAPVDPLEPPRFRHKKIPRGPPSPPAPVMHSPPRKVTADEQREWFIPPCISNWKNAKGYTIPLDKRLAADGRGLQEVVINDNFAKFAEALYVADRHAREEVEKRQLMSKKLAEKEKESKEYHLKQLAQMAREGRAGINSQEETSKYSDSDEEYEDEEYRERENIRRERDRELQKQVRQRATKTNNLDDREISEKVALGAAKPTINKDTLFDQRLFNQQQGIGSGFRDEEAYDLYDKPLFVGGASSIYRPKKLDGDFYGGEEEMEKILGTKRFVPNKSFSGTDSNTQRDGPVEFEKESDDPFGLDSFLENAKLESRKLQRSDEEEAFESKRLKSE